MEFKTRKNMISSKNIRELFNILVSTYDWLIHFTPKHPKQDFFPKNKAIAENFVCNFMQKFKNISCFSSQ